jgi:hypothetical protein
LRITRQPWSHGAMEPHGGRSAECKGKCKGRCHVAARARATKTKRTTTTTAARPETNERAVGRNSTAQRCAALRCAAAHTTPIRPPCSPAQTRHSPAEVAAQPADPPGRSCNHGVQASLAPPRPARKSDAVAAGRPAPRPLTRQRPGPASSHTHSPGTQLGRIALALVRGIYRLLAGVALASSFLLPFSA